MPELPEVETIKLVLQRRIIGLTIKKIQILSPKSFIGNPNSAEGQKVLKIERFAKLLAVNLGEVNLLFHLKMTGQLILQGESVKREGERYIGGHPILIQELFSVSRTVQNFILMTREDLDG